MSNDVYAERPGLSYSAWCARVREEAIEKLARYGVSITIAPKQNADGTRPFGEWSALTHTPPRRAPR